jgi:hypothetical protein
MEISTTTSHATGEAKVTSHYWGYRELTAAEALAVSGGDIGDYANGGDRGYGPGCESGNSSNCISTAQQLGLVNQTQAITAGPTTLGSPVSQGGGVFGAFFGSVRAGTLSNNPNPAPSPATSSPATDALGNQTGPMNYSDGGENGSR